MCSHRQENVAFQPSFFGDTAPELETRAPKGMVKVFPRRIDLENTDRLKDFEATQVVESLAALGEAVERRRRELAVNV